MWLAEGGHRTRQMRRSLHAAQLHLQPLPWGQRHRLALHWRRLPRGQRARVPPPWAHQLSSWAGAAGASTTHQARAWLAPSPGSPAPVSRQGLSTAASNPPTNKPACMPQQEYNVHKAPARSPAHSRHSICMQEPPLGDDVGQLHLRLNTLDMGACAWRQQKVQGMRQGFGVLPCIPDDAMQAGTHLLHG